MQYIRDEFPTTPAEPILRKYWNETVGKRCRAMHKVKVSDSLGLEFLDQLCVDDEDRAAMLVAVSHK
jgi:DNA mismatch repair protein MSH4